MISILLPRIRIGRQSLVAAGSMVTRDVPPMTMVKGYPAKVVCRVDELECHLDIVEKPYIDGRDVQAREGAGEKVLREDNDEEA